MPIGGYTSAAGLVRVLLCHHGDSGDGSSDGGSAACALLLHSMQLDSLHLLYLSSGGTGWSGANPLQQRDAPGQTGHLDGAPAAMLQTQILLLTAASRSLAGTQPSANQLLQRLLRQGLGSAAEPLQGRGAEQQPGALPSPAFSLLLPPAAQVEGEHEQASSSAITAQLVPLPPTAGSPGAQQLRVTAAADDLPGVLARHRGLCSRALQQQPASAAARKEPPFRQALADGALLPAVGAAGAVPGGGMVLDEAQLEAALERLRRLKAAAMGSGAANSETMQQLVLAARQAGSTVPVFSLL